MKMKMPMPGMPSCQDVHHRVASGAHEDSGWWSRFLVRMHLLMCVHCRRYADQVAAIGRGMRRLFGEMPSREHCERLERRIMAHVGGTGDRPA